VSGSTKLVSLLPRPTLIVYAHSFPMSYYRMAEQARGGGIQNNQDLLYIAASLELANELIDGDAQAVPRH
jgi:hypothetical protein